MGGEPENQQRSNLVTLKFGEILPKIRGQWRSVSNEDEDGGGRMSKQPKRHKRAFAVNELSSSLHNLTAAITVAENKLCFGNESNDVDIHAPGLMNGYGV